jgi:transposase
MACDEDSVVAIDVAEGQRNDAKLARGVLIEARDAVGGAAEVLGGEGFDSVAVRDVILDDLDALPAIPNRRNRKESWPWDNEMSEAYKQRNRVERAFAKAKQFRRFAFATRYEDLKDVHLGFEPVGQPGSAPILRAARPRRPASGRPGGGAGRPRRPERGRRVDPPRCRRGGASASAMRRVPGGCVNGGSPRARASAGASWWGIPAMTDFRAIALSWAPRA